MYKNNIHEQITIHVEINLQILFFSTPRTAHSRTLFFLCKLRVKFLSSSVVDVYIYKTDNMKIIAFIPF